jgi:hypothetical protein
MHTHADFRRAVRRAERDREDAVFVAFACALIAVAFAIFWL